MKNNIVKYVIFFVAILFIIFIVRFFMTSDKRKEDLKKKQKIDELYAIWISIASPSDVVMLSDTQKEKDIKLELYEKITNEELAFLYEYSDNFKRYKLESNIFNPSAIVLFTYLTTNFNKLKEISSKVTVIRDFLNRFGVSLARMQQGE